MTVEQQKRVLVVDDDPAIRQMLGWVLERQSLTVDQAADGAEALALLQDHQYAVVILDLLLPGINGFAVLDALAARQLAAPPVVLVITGADRRDTERLDPNRIHGVVRKPFDADELASIVVACAEIRGRSAFGTMAIATVIAGGPFLALLNRFSA
jgi:CheY-like chemotaxis protein